MTSNAPMLPAPPKANFTVQPSVLHARPEFNSAYFTDTSTDDSQIVGWSWIFGDASSGEANTST